LLVLIAIIIILRCRDIASPTDKTESEGMGDIPADGELSSMARHPFLSGENALSTDGKANDNRVGSSPEGHGDGRVLPTPDHE
jgi:hypothetical protein